MTNRFSHLPDPVDPSRLVVEVPASPDDRPAPEPAPPAAAPELVAATQVAQGSGAPRTMRSSQWTAGLLIAGVPIGVLVVVAVVQIALGG
jgi:hypothetical protein